MNNKIAIITNNSQSSQGSSFDIREHYGKLEPANEKNKYICPVCGGNDFSINPKTGAYYCFNNGCEPEDIRNAITPREKNPQRVNSNRSSSVPKLERLGVALVRIEGADIPKPSEPNYVPDSVKNKFRKEGATPEEISQIEVITYSYGDNKYVYRYQCPCAANEKGRSKTFSQSHIAEGGSVKWSKGNDPWHGYCLDEAIAAITQHNVQHNGIPLFLLQEGEDCVDTARSNGIASFTFQGSNWKDEAIKTELSRLKNEVPQAAIAFLHDNDDVGVKKAQKVEQVCSKLRIPFIAINSRSICAEIPNKGDIREILGQMDMDDFIRQLEAEIHKAVDGGGSISHVSAMLGDSNSNEIDPLSTLTQQAFGFFFYDHPWICVNDILYEWQEEGYYKLVKDAYFRPKIASYCNTFGVWNEKKEEREYPFADPQFVNKVLVWAKMRLEISDELVNPPGINCSNGILRVFWEKNKPTFKLVPHSPSEYYLYPGLVEYDPLANSPHCDRLLECLDDAQRQIFLRNISAAFDLANVRKIRGRMVKGLLPCRVGSNGKDALRAIVSLIFGHQGITSKTLADFQLYDEGKKFGLASLKYSRINWASENPKTTRLDSLQSLKAYITGQKLVSEKKRIDGEEFTPYGIGLWNINELPNLQGALQSSIDRFAPLTFRYIYKDDPDPTNKYELKADPRFVYDEDFQRLEVAPTFLNHMVNAFYALIEEGIDYTCTHEAYQQIQIENNHLFQFAGDINLDYKPDSQMTASEIWALLQPWYINEGILTIDGSNKPNWGETNRPSDQPVKAVNQVIPKIHKIFPKAKVARIAHLSGKKSVSVITGIGIVESPIPHPSSTPVKIKSPRLPLRHCQWNPLSPLAQTL